MSSSLAEDKDFMENEMQALTAEHETTIKEKDAQITDALDRIEAVLSEKAELDRFVSTLQSKLNKYKIDAENTKKNFETERHTAKKTIRALQSEMNEAKAEHKKYVTDINGDITACQVQLRQVRDEKEAQINECNRLTCELSKISADRETIDASHNQLSAEKAALTEEIENVKTEKKHAEETRDQLQREKESLDDKYQSLT
eukprot:8091380-Ditylum_brightwellii.AAC.1